MDTPPLVRMAGNRDRDAASRVLTDAFPKEPALNWWLHQDARKERARRRFFDSAVRDGVSPQRELWLAETDAGAPLGAAIWTPVGVKAFDLTPLRRLLLTPLLYSIAGVSGLQRAIALGEEMEAHHPSAPHAHLVFLGVATAAQGKGVGSEMLKTMLKPVDQAGVCAYLEATIDRNVALYSRHGFEVTAEFDIAGSGPHMWTMTRPAKTA